MSNFAFLPNQFQELKHAAQKAESHIHGDPRAACFHARFALEAAVHWLYRYDNTLRMPYDHSLNSLLHEPDFQNLIPQQLFHKAKAIQRIGTKPCIAPRPCANSTRCKWSKSCTISPTGLPATTRAPCPRPLTGMMHSSRAPFPPTQLCHASNSKHWKNSLPPKVKKPSNNSKPPMHSIKSCKPFL
ncbi:DUF4145 domain-containing protein [Thiothrix subterranea]|nr:DUF4145 domain-containing protein [Thiothrix subterranea]